MNTIANMRAIVTRRLLPGAAALALALAATASAARAQDGTTAVVIPASVHSALPPGGGGGFLDVLVGGKECGMFQLDTPQARAGEDLVLPLDLRSQFPECSRDGATLTLVTGEGRILPPLTVKKGARVTLASFAPEAPAGDGKTLLLVNRGPLAYTRTIEYLDFRADGVPCGRVPLARPAAIDEAGNAVFDLAAPGVPTACSRDGARLVFVDELGNELLREPIVAAGQRTMLAALGAKPPSTAGGAPAAPRPPATGTGAGTGREADLERWLPLAGLVAVASLLALRSRRRE
jgi:hypothetical protein